MKKIVAAILTAFLMSAGLVAATSTTATAACPYQGCIATETQAIGLKAKAPNKAKIFVKVSSFGNGQPDGRLQFTFVNKRGESITFNRAYPSRKGKSKVYNFRPLAKGRYDVIVTFIPSDDSAYEGSSDSTKVTVRGGRRR